MPDKDKGCVSVLPLMIYRAYGGRRLTMEEMIAFVTQYKECCDSLNNAPIDRIFEYTASACRPDLQRESRRLPEPEPEKMMPSPAQILQDMARIIRS